MLNVTYFSAVFWELSVPLVPASSAVPPRVVRDLPMDRARSMSTVSERSHVTWARTALVLQQNTGGAGPSKPGPGREARRPQANASRRPCGEMAWRRAVTSLSESTPRWGRAPLSSRVCEGSGLRHSVTVPNGHRHADTHSHFSGFPHNSGDTLPPFLLNGTV